MADIVIGQTYDLTLETAISLGSLGSHRIYYRKPKGTTGYLSATASTTSMTTTVPAATNNEEGVWRFYTYAEGAGGVVYKGKTFKQNVLKEYQD